MGIYGKDIFFVLFCGFGRFIEVCEVFFFLFDAVGREVEKIGSCFSMVCRFFLVLGGDRLRGLGVIILWLFLIFEFVNSRVGRR